MAIPVSLPDARRQLRLAEGDTSLDTELAQMIADSAAWVENYTGHILVARDVVETFRGLERVRLRAWPIKVDASLNVEYADDGGVPTTIAGVHFDLTFRPARIYSEVPSSWPYPRVGRVVTATFRAGYEDDEPVPGNLRRAMLVLIGGYDADREGGDLFAKAEASAMRLCRYFRSRSL